MAETNEIGLKVAIKTDGADKSINEIVRLGKAINSVTTRISSLVKVDLTKGIGDGLATILRAAEVLDAVGSRRKEGDNRFELDFNPEDYKAFIAILNELGIAYSRVKPEISEGKVRAALSIGEKDPARTLEAVLELLDEQKTKTDEVAASTVKVSAAVDSALSKYYQGEQYIKWWQQALAQRDEASAQATKQAEAAEYVKWWETAMAKMDAANAKVGAASSKPRTVAQALADFNKNAAESVKRLKEMEKELTPAEKAMQKFKDSISAAVSKFGKKNPFSFMERFFLKLKGISLYRAVRLLVNALFNGVKEGIQNFAVYDKSLGNIIGANGAMSRMISLWGQIKNTVGITATSIIQALMPAIETVANAFIRVLNIVNSLLAALRGGDFYRAKELNLDYAGSLDKASKSAGKLKRQLLGFDELNILTAGGGSGSENNFNDLFERAIPPAFSGEYADKIKQALADIELAVAGAALAVGAILTFTGINPGLGIPLMALGGWKVAKAAISWWTKDNPVASALTDLELILGGAFLAVGSLMLFSGANVGLGLALMGVGALTMGSGIAANWSAIEDPILKTIASIETIVGGALLAVGAILAITGINTPLGLWLLAGGAAAMFPGIAASLSGILPEKVQDTLGKIATIAAASLIPMGLILILTGAGIPLGIGMLLAGGAALATAASLNWNSIVEKVVGVWNKIKLWWRTKVAPIFTKEWWEEKIFTPIKEALEKAKNFALDVLGTIKKEMEGDDYQLGGFGSGYKPSTYTKKDYLKDALDVNVFATGGYPDAGSMFLAGEAGPELVGTINGRTGVINNDQFGAMVAMAADNIINAILSSGQNVAAAAREGGNTYLDSVLVSRQLYSPLQSEGTRRGSTAVQFVGE